MKGVKYDSQRILQNKKRRSNLYKTYSDQELKIQKVGTDEIYSSAIDVEDAPFEYVETDLPIEKLDDFVTDSEQLTTL